MCGFAGVCDGQKSALLRPLLKRLRHRGPDGEGLWHDEHHTLAHTRLSIIDLPGGAQPMSDRQKRQHIVFNGEIYNYRKLRQELGVHRFSTHSDTETILELAAGGEEPRHWVRRLDGMFAFALTRGSELVLARDPLGIKPLYIGHRRGRMVFGSEIKALLPLADEVAEFPPGHVYTTRSGLQRYYLLDAPEEQVSVEEAQAGLLKRLEAAVVKRLIADVPVGVFLSGGLDSSVIAALAARHKEPLNTFSVCTTDSPDRAPARQMAEFLGTRHHERVYDFAETVAALPEVIYYLESFDCALVRSAIPNYFLAKLASQHVKVALGGEGADELFAGYEYLKELKRDEVRDELRHITLSLHNTNLQRCDRMSMAHGLEVRVPFLDVALVDYAFRLPAALKQRGTRRCEKWILRKMSEPLLPREIAWRRKLKFASGAGLGEAMARLAEKEISAADFKREREIGPGVFLRSKEELYYYRIFRQTYHRQDILPLIGRSRSV